MGDDGKAGVAGVSAEIDRLNAQAAQDDPLNLGDLLALMRVLRDPERGCPWDRQQDFATIAPYTIEEAYEVADAIARDDLAGLKDELGDLLLQVVYHAQMAQEDGDFDFAAVVDAITRKMIRRHPHVFGDEQVRAVIEVSGLWDRIKAQEAQEKRDGAAATANSGAASVLDGVPVGLPALMRSVKIQKKAAKVGFDWGDAAPILDKIREELGELEVEIAVDAQERIAEEFGDLLFVIANLGRHISVDPEAALRAANLKFERRFHHIESALRKSGVRPESATLEQMEALWQEAKMLEKSKSSPE